MEDVFSNVILSVQNTRNSLIHYSATVFRGIAELPRYLVVI
jgi:hypothetical protein